jgi:nucleotide-binding universal stress UspA family protein
MTDDNPTPSDTDSPSAAPIDELRFRRVLVATDGSPSADLALSTAITAAHRDRAQITLMSVATDVAAQMARWPGTVVYAENQDDADAAAQRVIDDALRRLPQDVSVTTVLRRGHAAKEVLAVAADGDYDAILVGARGVGRVGALMGSVSQEILHHAKIAVFVAHVPA